MRKVGQSVRRVLNTRMGFFVLAIVLFWLKTWWTYVNKFNLGAKGSVQELLLMINPLPTTILLFGIALYLAGRKSYIYILVIDFITSFWLYANVLYYREFSDFLSINLIKGSGAVSNNLGKSVLGIMEPTDFLVFLDVLLLILVLAFKWIRMDIRPIKKRFAFTVTGLSIVLFGFNLFFAQSDRPGLLTRTFDNNYIVKYLGLNTYTVYDGVKTAKSNAAKKNANASDLRSIESYIKENRVPVNAEYTGVAKGKNVLIFHLESFQQFLIDFKWDDQEVTPNLNKLYHSSDTLSFDNFFNQVGTGKTADAEMMLENSLFGLAEGPAMVQYGTTNTFQAAPAIFDQDGYTSASFHGDVPSFWNRDNTYKSWGYDYFFSSAYYQQKASYSVGYGLKDKIFLKDSAQYLEKLPQPFYAKLITVTNHYPYLLDKQNQTIAKTDTGDSTVDGYVQTAKYLDQAVGEFMTWLDESGLAKNTMVVFYGDHYGISGNHKKAVAKLLGKDKFDNFDDAQFQRVPLMIHMPGLKGGINHTYSGEIDVLPTILNLAGIKNDDTIQFGQDILSPEKNQTVAFRNGDFVSPDYTKVGNTYYDTKTGDELKKPDDATQKTLEEMTNHVATELSLSDSVITGDLLRFYSPNGFDTVNKAKFSYKKSTALKKLKEHQNEDSLYSQSDDKSTTDLYKTDAPELNK